MAKYIVEESKREKFEPSYKLPFVQLIPALIWSIPLNQYLLADLNGAAKIAISIAFIVLYLFLSFKPVIAIAPCVAGVIIFTALGWAPADHIGNDVVRVIVKIVILAFFAMLEFCVWINATLPWLEKRFAGKPRIRVER